MKETHTYSIFRQTSLSQNKASFFGTWIGNIFAKITIIVNLSQVEQRFWGGFSQEEM